MTFKHISFVALTTAFLAACGGGSESNVAQPSQIDASLIENGKELIEANCSSCHAVGLSDESMRSDAPPLRYVLTDRDVEALADDFREGIHVGADDMPDFDFGPLGTDAVIGYLQSIQAEPDKG